MPYANANVQAEYNRHWARRNRATAANSPLCRAVEAIVALADPQPVSPSEIQAKLARSTRNSISTALDRLKHAGRVQNVGYGQWVLAEGNTIAADIRLLLDYIAGRRLPSGGAS